MLHLKLETTSISKGEAIQKWTDVGIALSKVTATQDNDALVQAVKSLSSAIPYLGFVLSSLLDITVPAGNSELGEIKNQLNKADGHLFAIKNKIDELSNHVQKTSLLSYYKKQGKTINFIQRKYQRYLYNHNTDITSTELIDSCQQNDILEYIDYVYRQLAYPTSIQPLMEVMKDKNDLANFQYWMKMLTGSISQSMMLHTICMSVKYQDDRNIYITMDNDMLYFKNMSNVMLTVLKDGMKDIKQNFFKTAITEIESYATKKADATHKKFCTEVYDMLTLKYFWRYWQVLSYDSERYSKNEHALTGTNQYVYTSIRKFGRNIQVAHTNNNDNSIQVKLRAAMNRRGWDAKWVYHLPERCKFIYDYVSDNLDGHNSIAVYNSQSESYFMRSKESTAVYEIESQKLFLFTKFNGYFVHVVAPEK